MEFAHRTTICTLFFLILMGSAFAQKVQTDFDHQANFSQYKTYSWQEIKPANSLLGRSNQECRGCPIGSQGLDPGGQRRRCGPRSDQDLADTENTPDVL